MHDSAFEFLRAATPYIAQFRGKTFVVKIGGDLLSEPAAVRHLSDQLSLLHHLSIPLVIVHGAGPQVDAQCERMGIPVEKIGGRRVTSEAVLEAAKMVFAGSVHTDFLAELRAAHLPVVGLSGVDAGLVHAHRRPPIEIKKDGEDSPQTVDFGLVGDIDSVNPAVLSHLLAGGFVPVIAPLGGGDGNAVYNINADTIAAAVASRLDAEKLFFLVRVPGLLETEDDLRTLISYVTAQETLDLEAKGVVRGGMRPKCRAARDALDGGVRSVHLVSGYKPDALLREVFTNEGSGTMVVADEKTS